MTQSEILDLFLLKFGDKDRHRRIHKLWLSLDRTSNLIITLDSWQQDQQNMPWFLLGKILCESIRFNESEDFFFQNVSDEKNFNTTNLGILSFSIRKLWFLQG